MIHEEKYALGMKIVAWLEQCKGQQIYIQEAITDRDFDRHGTSHVRFSMVLESCHTRFSGARTMLEGSNKEYCEFPIDGVEATFIEHKIELLEVLHKDENGKQLLRQTVIETKDV